MGSVEQVCALPGGGAFAEIWEQVDGDPGSISEAAAALTKVAEGVRSAQRGFGSAAAGVGDGWRGPAAGAFERYASKVGSASANVEQTLHKSAAELRSAAQEIEQAKDEVRRAADRVLDRVRQVEHFVDEAPDFSLMFMIEQAVAEGCAVAAPIAQALSTRLSDVASTLRTAGNVGGYGHLAPPGEGSYLPAPGGHIDWSAVPKAGEHGSTRPAGAGGSSGGSGGSSGGSGGSSGGSGGVSSGGPPGAMPTGNVKSWIEQATKILEEHGYEASQLDAAGINMIIQHESSGNPHAQNDWDSNAKAGHPSKGIMQTIDSTFNQYALPDHKDIWNPVDNIIAGVRYAISRYGSIDNVPGVKAVHNGGSYVGY